MNVAIIAAAGKGTRMAGSLRKQFLELAGKPVVFHTLERFEQCDAIEEIILVLPPEETAAFDVVAAKTALRKLVKIVAGGVTRAESVFNGLMAVNQETAEIVAVHDGVRPFVTSDEIARTVEAAKHDAGAILVSKPVDTIKEIKDGAVARTLDRATIRNALTPQCFQYKILRRAYEQVDVSDPQLTDEASLVERLGLKIAIVEGSQRNIKITRPEDIVIAEALLKLGVKTF
jgi:2-C-methyl-D-erythritol 4-phosphate cytidylyltransferase